MGRVVVFGSLNMDIAIESGRIPRQGETIPGWGFLVNEGGKGANQAVAAARFGVPTAMIGAVGCDVFGESIVTSLEKSGVECTEVVRLEQVETGTAIVLKSGGDNRIILNEGANTALGFEQVDAALSRIAHSDDVFLAQLECDLDTTAAALESAHSRGMITILNAAPAHELDAEVWKSIDVLCVNESECESICGVFPGDEKMLLRALGNLSSYGPKFVVITLGGRGSAALTEKGVIRQRALSTDVVDTTAAGDTYIGVLASSLIEGHPIECGMRLATCAASIAASRRGAQQSIPSRFEVECAMREEVLLDE